MDKIPYGYDPLWTRFPMDNHCVCKCGDVVQTLRHIILHCPLLQHIRNSEIDDVKFFKSKEATKFILEATKALKIEM